MDESDPEFRERLYLVREAHNRFNRPRDTIRLRVWAKVAADNFLFQQLDKALSDECRQNAKA